MVLSINFIFITYILGEIWAIIFLVKDLYFSVIKGFLIMCSSR